MLVPSIPGALGRVLLISSNINDDEYDIIEMIQLAISEQIDQLIYQKDNNENATKISQNNKVLTK